MRSLQTVFTHPLVIVYTAAYLLLNIVFYPVLLILSDITAYTSTAFITFVIQAHSIVLRYMFFTIFFVIWGLIGILAAEIFVISSLWYYRTLRNYLPQEHSLTIRMSPNGLNMLAYTLASILFLHRLIMFFGGYFGESIERVLYHFANIALPLSAVIFLASNAFIFLLYDSYHETYTHLLRRSIRFIFKHMISYLTIILCTGFSVYGCIILEQYVSSLLITPDTSNTIPVLNIILLCIYIVPIIVLSTGYFLAKTSLYLLEKRKVM